MNYISAKDASIKWNISVRQVQHLCSDGKIVGAISLGKQWLIPENADRPIDGRTKNAKCDMSIDSYHFPMLIHSRYYATEVGLSDVEKQILKAQVLNLKGEYEESIMICRDVVASTYENYIKFACYITLAYNYMLLGTSEKFLTCVSKLESIINKEVAHKEDFVLAYSGLMLHIEWNRKALLNIDANKISSDAIIYFQSMIIESSYVNNEKASIAILKLYETLSRDLETHGIISTLLMSHCLLSALYNRNKKTELSEFHAIKAIELAEKYSYLNYVSKYYLSNKKIYDRILKNKNKETLELLKKKNLENYKRIEDVYKKEFKKPAKLYKFNT